MPIELITEARSRLESETKSSFPIGDPKVGHIPRGMLRPEFVVVAGDHLNFIHLLQALAKRLREMPPEPLRHNFSRITKESSDDADEPGGAVLPIPSWFESVAVMKNLK
jgi:hypothetical protein